MCGSVVHARAGGATANSTDDTHLHPPWSVLRVLGGGAVGEPRQWPRLGRLWAVMAPSAYSIPFARSRDGTTTDKTALTPSSVAALAQVGERHEAMADGRPHGDANDGAVLGDSKRISGALVSPSQSPSHVLTPLTFPRDGVGACRSSQSSLVVVLTPLERSGAAGRSARTSGADGRGVWLCGRREGRMLCSHVMAPRSRCVALLGLWCMVHGAEDCCKRPEPNWPVQYTLIGARALFWSVWRRVGRVN